MDPQIVTKEVFQGLPAVKGTLPNLEAHRFANEAKDTVVKAKQKFMILASILWTSGVAIALVIPPVIGYALEITVARVGKWALGIYGMTMAVHFIAQVLMASTYQRRIRADIKSRSDNWHTVQVGLLLVGYREDPTLFKECLGSLLLNNYPNVRQLIIMIDGDEKEDLYMGDLFLDVFNHNTWTRSLSTASVGTTRHPTRPILIRPGFRMFDEPRDSPRTLKLIEMVQNAKGPVCIQQPHGNKRIAMYTGYRCLCAIENLDAVMVSDSDSILLPDTMLELAWQLRPEKPKVGAACGEVRLLNVNQTWVTFVTSLRYWFAFQVDRSAQALASSVTCVSGPIGIYRVSFLCTRIDEWVNQQFLGVLCTYGDDRHMTNLALKDGYDVVYTPGAVCYSESPPTFVRWVAQQTRWAKSSYREALLSIQWFHKFPLWLAYETTYNFVYPILLIYSTGLVLYTGEFWHLLFWLDNLIAVGFMKALYAILYTRHPKFLLIPVYGVLYLAGVLPSKIQAIFLLWDSSWGTSTRLRMTVNYTHIIIPVAWISVIAVGVALHLYRYISRKPIEFGNLETALVSFVGAYATLSVLGYLIWKWKLPGQAAVADVSKRVNGYKAVGTNDLAAVVPSVTRSRLMPEEVIVEMS
ncbi:Hyaluronan synthase 3 [Geranomyces variabilis]|nr:Hyaluronan synthase 3 [Geranomyces variabilis]